jgi:arylsulfatase A-like enzyme
VIFADDLGYADLAVQGQEKDLFTPNLDRMAAQGVRCTAGYATAPQCSPSRAGLLTGRYQQRVGIDTIPDLPLANEEVLIPEMLAPAGYTSAMVGKWHLEPNVICRKWIAEHLPDAKPDKRGFVNIPLAKRIPYLPESQGFDHYFCGEMNHYRANFTRSGKACEPSNIEEKGFRVDIQSDAAVAFIDHHHDAPFFLYLSYYAPHTPLVTPEPYADRFSKDMAVRRRAALAMIHGVDHGVGRVLDALERNGIDDNTIVFFTSDNGAPVHKRRDSPLDVDMGGWDGSLNTPWVGEKGMLAEGGIRVPYLVRWPGKLPAGKVFSAPVSTLDIAATARSVAGLPADPRLDGVDLLPLMKDEAAAAPERALYWRFWNQIAIREGRWKYLNANSQAEFLFDLDDPAHEKKNLAKSHPEIVERLRRKSTDWAAGLKPPGVPHGTPDPEEVEWFREYFDAELK